jgi:alanine or glycine:cation symporter, AGCS family
MYYPLLLTEWFNWLIGWPLLLYVVSMSLICSVMLQFIQIRKLIPALKQMFSPAKKGKGGDVSPFQAFINTINSNIGNGSLAGMGVALFTGGPGAIFWIVIFGTLLAVIRFAEVYISTAVAEERRDNTLLGGPMLYLREVPAGYVVSYLYALLCLPYAFCGGSSIQGNSIFVSLERTMQAPAIVVAAVLFVLVLYVALGGAQRISQASAVLVPLKVGLFLLASCGVILYHFFSIPSALYLIIVSAFSPKAIQGGIAGFTILHAIKAGMNSIVFASEAGLGTAAILFGYTGKSNPKENAYLGMLSVFCTTIICFLVGLCIVLSGAYHTGLNSSALTIVAFESLFGRYAGIIVSILSILFGIGVIVSFAYITRAVWNVVTGGRWTMLFPFVYATSTAIGVIADVEFIWYLASVINAGLLVINIAAIVYLIPRYRTNMIR